MFWISQPIVIHFCYQLDVKHQQSDEFSFWGFFALRIFPNDLFRRRLVRIKSLLTFEEDKISDIFILHSFTHTHTHTHCRLKASSISLSHHTHAHTHTHHHLLFKRRFFGCCSAHISLPPNAHLLIFHHFLTLIYWTTRTLKNL